MTPLNKILNALREHGTEPRLSGNDWMCRCPAHEDSTPSLSIREKKPGGRIFVKCFAGCKDTDILKRLGLSVKDLFPEGERVTPPLINVRSGLKVEDLAAAKNLPVGFLKSLGVDTTWVKKTTDNPKQSVVKALVDEKTWASLKAKSQWREVLIPYREADGSDARPRRRMLITSDPQSPDMPKCCWAGTKDSGEIVPYGLDRLQHARDKGYLILVEGETDCWAGWLHGFPVLGIPGATNTKVLSREHLDGIGRVYLVKEPDQGGETFYDAIRNRVSSWKSWKGELLVIRQPGGAKDICDLRQKNPDAFEAEMERALAGAEVVPLAQPEEIKTPAAEEVDAIIAEGSIPHLFDQVATFARLDKAEFGKVKARIKEAFGHALNLTDFTSAVREARNRIRRTTLRDASALPSIMTSGRQLRHIVQEGMDALLQANNPPILFSRSGSVAVLHHGDSPEKGAIHIKSLSSADTASMKDHLTRAADFYKSGPDGEDVPCTPPYDVAAVLLSRPDQPFPQLDGVTQSPVIREDGTILTQPGYDALSRLYYVPGERLNLPDIPEQPTPEDVRASVELLNEMVCDFPFVDEACRANLFALFLSIVMRPLIDGCVPLALLDAPRQGTGKGLLAAIVSLVTTGGEPAIMTIPQSANDDEWRKRITSTLMGGPSVVFLDNIDEPMDSPSLAAMLTAREWEDRRLGVSENVRLPVRAVWFGTGNNIQLHGDMPRRCYHVRIDSNLAQPWRRNGFRHPNLREWVTNNRGRLLAALLTIARGWCVNGRPVWSGSPLGSFENWCRVIGGVLEYAGIRGFLGNIDRLYEDADEDTLQWIAFLCAWHKTFGSTPVRVRDLCAQIIPNDRFCAATEMRIALPDDLVTAVDKGTGNLARRIGIALRSRRDTIHGAYRLTYADLDQHNKVALWKVEQATSKPAQEDESDDSRDFSTENAGSAGSEKRTPSGISATVSPFTQTDNMSTAGNAGNDSIYSAHKRGLSQKMRDHSTYIYSSSEQLFPAFPAEAPQPIDNTDSYNGGSASRSPFSTPAHPATSPDVPISTTSGEAPANEAPSATEEPYFERWIVE